MEKRMLQIVTDWYISAAGFDRMNDGVTSSAIRSCARELDELLHEFGLPTYGSMTKFPEAGGEK